MSYNVRAVRPDGRCVGGLSTCAGLGVLQHSQAAAFLFSMGIIARNVERCKRGVSRPYGLTSPSGRGGFGPAGPKTERATLSGRFYSILSDRTAPSPCVALSVTASPCQLPQRGSQRPSGLGGMRASRPTSLPERVPLSPYLSLWERWIRPEGEDGEGDAIWQALLHPVR